MSPDEVGANPGDAVTIPRGLPHPLNAKKDEEPSRTPRRLQAKNPAPERLVLQRYLNAEVAESAEIRYSFTTTRRPFSAFSAFSALKNTA